MQRRGELLEGGARVCEVCVAAGARRGELVRFEDGVGGPPRVERRVDVEEAVAFVVLRSR